ncbi:MAG: hypothetical protein IJA69_04380 [Clostridia bacterium]|nr:hypothetical protein [Clostridia bacterium]
MIKDQLGKLFSDDVEKYELNPQKTRMWKIDIQKRLLNNLSALNGYGGFDEDKFKERICQAKAKNMDILKGIVECDICNRGQEQYLSPILACAYGFFHNEKQCLTALKYLLVNGDIEKHKDDIKIAFSYLFKDKRYTPQSISAPIRLYTRDGICVCTKEFKEIFNIFLGLGADVEQMFPSLQTITLFLNGNKNFIEMLISLNDPKVNKFLCDNCYTGDYVFAFNLLKQHNINEFSQDSADAIIKNIASNKKNPQWIIERAIWLLKQGALKPEYFSEDKVVEQMKDMKFYNSYEEKQFLKIFTDILEAYENNKKVSQKTSLPSQMIQKTIEEQQVTADFEIEKIYNQAQKNVEMER